ncbi:protein of unknown function DUF75 [Staphylothermus marinus F1]|uniref:Proteasome assembly chaperone family protein n=1 Tax=Staphylothermus marinus (strain ATCC 43588 / DSM 3639 / JCM 9404 / F1) TaxID=399550 RepID=A3DP10_STAMF|nr:PAC2 family protein [Staphylothermus marinus]ABN70370.1 protein of unknown function DUF75 [Staphylothermus marinus F1]
MCPELVIKRPKRTLTYERLIIHEYFDPYEEPTPEYLVLGLPDAGLVGAIASRYLVINKNLKLVGEIDSPAYFPPVTVIHKSTPMSPIQMYMPSDRKYLVLLSEAPIPASAVYPLSLAILEYSGEIGIKHIISISGIAAPNRLQIEKPRSYWLASTASSAELLKDKGLEELREGFIVGPYAIILKEARRRGINNLVIFVESFFDLPDPESAAEALKILSQIINVDIDVSKLLEEAELIKLQTRELMRQTRKSMSEMQKKFEMQMPLMYQ